MLQFTNEIVDDVLFRAGEPTDGTSDFNAVALDKVNRAYRAIYIGGSELVPGMNEPWLWLKKDPPGTLIVNPIINTGSVSVANNSAAITFSSAPAVSVAGRFFKVDSEQDVFRVSAHIAGQAAATLDSIYTGPTDAAAAYKLMQLEYSLPADCIRIIAPMRTQEDFTKIEGVELTALDRDYPLAFIEGGTPDRFALVTEGKVRFNRYGGLTATDLVRVEFDYLARPADLADDPANEPLIPLEFRHVLADCALFYLLSDKSDNRASGVGAQAKAGLLNMQANNRAKIAKMGANIGRIFVRPRGTGTGAVRVLTVGG